MKSNFVLFLTFLSLSIHHSFARHQHFLNGSERTARQHEHTLEGCLFCNIINGNEPAKIIAENNDVIVFETIRPRHTSHWLIIPKKHISNFKSASSSDTLLLGKLLIAAGALGKQLQKPQAFNLQINEGSEAGQTIPHVHIHFYSAHKLVSNSPII